MTCDAAQRFLDSYVDRELDAVNSLNIEQHLSDCANCARRVSQLEALRKVIATEAPRYSAPDALRTRVKADLRGPASQARARSIGKFAWKWGAIAASLLVATLTVWQMRLHSKGDEQNLLAAEIVSSHVRSLMADHLVDEPSSDQHAVKPWFAGKLDFSPSVKNLDGEGFLLSGGRLDYMNGRPVAAIVYRRREHVINVFVWPSSQAAAGPHNAMAIKGFNILNWRSGGLGYWAISDLNDRELELFSRLFARP